MADKIEDVMNLRNFSGNAHYVQALKEGRIVKQVREGDDREHWHLDGRAAPDAEGAR
ncbi:hypothetical protein JJJ17_11950 [Paracoccus caeni]|uniref:Uncharacterized protein n=1 Tax=Paracoccus caeni TaxID=657651 RepID=A0A934SFU5_9RHOB|nr:hypothetical protein [Paracoccus caeni]MBK4216640.1 hypothetical protein [Paracoccus caeni]